MPKDFLDDLEQDIEQFDTAIRDHTAGTEAHVAARAALDITMETALNAVRRLDAAVPNRIGDDAATLAVWTRARRIAPAPRRGELDPADGAADTASMGTSAAGALPVNTSAGPS